MGEIRLPTLFADNMVLQQQSQVPIWGWVEPGETVHIKGSWQPMETSTEADTKGRWSTPVKPYYLQMDQTGPGHYQSPAALYNGMIAPLIPFRIRGVIWFQGECNSWQAWQYQKLFSALIANWREDWGQGIFPFNFVQISPFDYSIFDSIDEPIAAELREAQRLALAVPNLFNREGLPASPFRSDDWPFVTANRR